MTEIPNLAVDVLIEILLQLPVKQVCQLKIVSKQWLLTISSRHFKILYNKRSMRTPRLLVVEVSNKVESDHGTLSRTFDMSTMDISTGVICRQFSKRVIGRHYSLLSLSNLFCYDTSICNPTTREHEHLPYANFPRYGFYCGYIEDSNEYKLIKVCSQNTYKDKDKKYEFRILTLKDGESVPSRWRIIANDTPNWSYKPVSVSIKCSIYWLINNNSKDHRKKSIISLDLETERFTTISYPDISLARENDAAYELLIEIKGDLCLAKFLNNYSTVIILVRKDIENNDIWVKEYTIDLPNVGRWFTLVGYLPRDDNNGEIIFQAGNKNLLSYNINEKSFQTLGDTQLTTCYSVRFYYDRLFSFRGQRLNIME